MVAFKSLVALLSLAAVSSAVAVDVEARAQGGATPAVSGPAGNMFKVSADGKAVLGPGGYFMDGQFHEGHYNPQAQKREAVPAPAEGDLEARTFGFGGFGRKWGGRGGSPIGGGAGGILGGCGGCGGWKSYGNVMYGQVGGQNCYWDYAGWHWGQPPVAQPCSVCS